MVVRKLGTSLTKYRGLTYKVTAVVYFPSVSAFSIHLSIYEKHTFTVIVQHKNEATDYFHTRAE